MHRIDGPGATGGNLFTEGNPATAVPATQVTDDWLNDVQEELMSILAAASIAPVKGTQNQVLLALRSAGLFTTPPQFDNDTSAATTEFVQRALGNYRGVINLAVSGSLTTANIGTRTNVLTGVAATIPAASGVPQGACILLAGDGTFTPAGGDTLFDITGVSVTNVNIGYGSGLADFTEVMRTGATSWQIIGGTGALKYSPGFQKSLSTSGYQKLPSGMIIQYGAWTSPGTTGVAQAVTFPISFPTACQSLVTAPATTNTSSSSAWYDNKSISGFNGRANVINNPCNYVAIGY